MAILLKEVEGFAVSKLKPLKQPWKKWYYLHLKYVGIAAVDIMPKADKEAFLIAGWMHDLAKVKKSDDHAKRSAIMAEKFLNGKMDNRRLKIVLDCIKHHSNEGKPKTKEAKAFKNADKLATFYPEIRNYVKRVSSRKDYENTLKDHFSRIQSRRVKLMAQKLLKKK